MMMIDDRLLSGKLKHYFKICNTNRKMCTIKIQFLQIHPISLIFIIYGCASTH